MVEAPVLAGPHLVLAHARGDDGVVGGRVAQHLQHVLGLEQFARLGLLVDERVALLPAADLRAPRPAVGLGVDAPAGSQSLDQVRDDQLAVAPDGHVGGPDLAEFGRVDVDVDHLGVGREAVEATGDPVVEAGAQRDQQV